MKQIYLLPGQWAYSKVPAQITTILGSCVAVALYDYRLKTGALNHYLLSDLTLNEPPSARYGAFAIPAIIEEMIKNGSDRKSLQAKVYGGGSVLTGVTLGDGIGNRNVSYALQMLEEYRIPVVDRNVAGTRGRRIVFNTSTFEVDHQFQGVAPQKASTSNTGPVQAMLVGGSGSADHLTAFLSKLNSSSPAVVVMSSTVAPFLGTYLAQLKKQFGLDASIAQSGDALLPGKIYFASFDAQVKIMSQGFSYALDVKPSNSPSSFALFESAALSVGPAIMGVFVGGLGADGERCLQSLQLVGAQTSIVA